MSEEYQDYVPEVAQDATDIWDDVKKRVSLEDYFANYRKVELRPAAPGQSVGLCPYHDEKSASFRIYSNGSDETFHCYGCQKHGTIIDAVMFSENLVEPLDALNWLNKEYNLGLNTNSPGYKKFKEQTTQATKTSSSAEKELLKDSNLAKVAREYLKGRKISPETAKVFQLGLGTTGRLASRITIPIKDKGDHVVNVTGRSLWDEWTCKECKYVNKAKDIWQAKQEGGDPTSCLKCNKKTIPSFVVWQHPKYRNESNSESGKYLYNEPIAKKDLLDKEKNNPLFIMEGYADVWSCYEAGYKSAVAYNGSHIKPRQAAEAVKLVDQAKKSTNKSNKYILLVPDFDTTGKLTLSKNIDFLRRTSLEEKEKELRKREYNLNEEIKRLRGAAQEAKEEELRQVRKQIKIKEYIEIKVLYGVDEYTKKDPKTGEEVPCKDLNDILIHHGKDVLHDILTNNRMSADEYKIREILNFDASTKEDQINLVRAVLAEVQHAIELDHLVPEISKAWEVEDTEVKRFLYSETANKEAGVGMDLISTVEDAHEAAVEYLKDGFTIKTGLPTIDNCLPGGGFRLRQLSLWLGKSGVGKTNLCLNLIRNMAQYQDIPVIFFSLEQPKAQLYMRLVQMILQVDSEKAHQLVRDDVKKELKKVDDALKNLIIIDGVPDEGNARPEMTPATIARFIQEVNLVRLRHPATAIFLDHLGICKAGDNAPTSAKNDENALAGYLMEEFFSVCKETNTFFIVLQQLPKEVKPGKEFSYDAGRGGSRQTDFSDYIFCIWRPEQDEELDEEGKIAVEGQYKLKLGKNRHGMSNTATCIFDWKTLGIEEGGMLNTSLGKTNDTKEIVQELVNDVAENGGDSINMPGLENSIGEDVPDWFDN